MGFMKKCPRCYDYYIGYPAISRRDCKTEICSSCGVSEEMFDFALGEAIRLERVDLDLVEDARKRESQWLEEEKWLD